LINLLVALQAEAGPIIRHFGLNGLPAVAGFHRYGNADINLLVTGVGPVAMASGVTVLGLESAMTPAAWINVGIAGHADLPIGTPLLASKITDLSSGLCWYPPQALQLEIPRCEVKTVATPAQQYPADAAIEMEASGFYPTACRFATGERVQCLKVVSDNRDNPPTQLNAAVIGERIGELLGSLEILIDELSAVMAELSPSTASPADLQPFIEGWRFSQTQRTLLSRLLHDYRLLSDGVPQISEFKAHRRGADLLAALQADLLARRLDYSLTPPEMPAADGSATE